MRGNEACNNECNDSHGIHRLEDNWVCVSTLVDFKMLNSSPPAKALNLDAAVFDGHHAAASTNPSPYFASKKKVRRD
jgi:hypothetical protein